MGAGNFVVTELGPLPDVPALVGGRHPLLVQSAVACLVSCGPREGRLSFCLGIEKYCILVYLPCSGNELRTGSNE